MKQRSWNAFILRNLDSLDAVKKAAVIKGTGNPKFDKIIEMEFNKQLKRDVKRIKASIPRN